MAGEEDAQAFMTKAEENLASAQSELGFGRYNASANRCYYGSFQAAIAALLREGIGPTRAARCWGHGYVQAQFAGVLVGRRKLYAALRDTLPQLLAVRVRAD